MDRESFFERMHRGRKFEEWERSYWTGDGNEDIGFETPTRWKGKRGRIDIRLADAKEGRIVVVELKASDWDKMSPHRVRSNALRHARQIWRYIEAELLQGQENTGSQGILPAIVYSTEPKTPGRKDTVETILKERGIQVVWREIVE
jgi:hypothetical protein